METITVEKKRSELHKNILDNYPKVTSTGIFFYCDEQNAVIVCEDDNFNLEFLKFFKTESSSSNT